jgi:hypothetical protein
MDGVQERNGATEAVGLYCVVNVAADCCWSSVMNSFHSLAGEPQGRLASTLRLGPCGADLGASARS